MKAGRAPIAPGGDFLRIADLTIAGGRFATRQATVLVKSHNADIVIDGADLRPADGVILKSVLNDSKRSALLQWLLNPRRPDKVVTGPVTGIRASLRNMTVAGDIQHLDTTRTMALTLVGTRLTGAITGTVRVDPPLQTLYTHMWVWFLLMGGARQIPELYSSWQRGGEPDTGALSNKTHLSSAFFVALFWLGSLAALIYGGVLLLQHNA